jgi:hypothetical protein
MKKRFVRWWFIFGCVMCISAARASAETQTADLWDVVTITIPGNVGFFEADTPRGGPSLHENPYVFISSDGHTALTAGFVDAADSAPTGWDTFINSRDIQVNGLAAIRVDGPLFSRIAVKLPPPKGCPVQNWVWLVFTRGDAEGEKLAKTIRLKPNFPCLTAVP